jgi:hypothetical protein
MKLEFDGEYRSRLINKCRTVRDRDDLPLLNRTTNLMMYLNVSKGKCIIRAKKEKKTIY